MRKVLIIISILGLIVVTGWFVLQPSGEPLSAILFAISGLLSLIYPDSEGNNSNNSDITFNQKGGKKSNNHQSNGPMTINYDRKK